MKGVSIIGHLMSVIGGFMIGFSLPGYGNLPSDHIMLPLGAVLVVVGLALYLRKD
jgi:hypothetical protein